MGGKLETKVAVGGLLTFLVVAIVCVISYQTVREANATSRTVARTYQVLTS